MRVIATGLLGLLWKKKDKFLVLDRDESSGLNVPVVLSFNAAHEALAEIQSVSAAYRTSIGNHLQPVSATESTAVQRMRQLKELLDEGFITEAEFVEKRGSILSDL
jgi:hypothetical protein